MCEKCVEESRPESVAERRIFFRLLPVIFGLAIVLLGLWTAHAVSRTETLKRSLVRQEAEDRYSAAAVAAFRRQLDSLAAIAKNACLLYAASDEVDAEEWATFRRINAVSHQPGLDSIEYLPSECVSAEMRSAMRKHGSDWSASIALFDSGESGGEPGGTRRLRMWMPVYNKAAIKGATSSRDGDAEPTLFSGLSDDAEAGDAMEELAAIRPSGYIVMKIDAGELLDRARSDLAAANLALHWGHPDGVASRCVAYTGDPSLLHLQARDSRTEGAAGGDSADSACRSPDSGAARVLRRPVQWGLSPLWLTAVPPRELASDSSRQDTGLVWAVGGLATLAAAGLMLGFSRLGSAVKRAHRVFAETLAESRRQYHVLFKSTLEGLMVLDEDLRVYEINPAAARLLRTDAEKATGRRLDTRVTLEGGALRRQVGRVLSWRVPECGQWRWTAGGTLYEIDGSLAAVQIGGRWKCLTAFHNATQQNAARRELEATAESLQEANARLRAYSEAVERSSRDRIAFVASMWHEIRSPLSLIVSYARLLQEGCRQNAMDRSSSCSLPCGCGSDAKENADSVTRCEAVEAVLNNGEHLLQLVNDILDFSKLEAGQVRLDIRPVSPRDVIEQVISMYRIRARDKGIRLEIATAPNVPERILTDPLRLRQIIANLTDNAIKFTQRGFVRIEADFAEGNAGEPKLYIRVRDTGIGMSEEQLGRLFQPFAQAEASTARKYGGTGLGLVICRRLGRLLGGDVWAESGPGRGTVFHVQVAGKIAQAEPPEADSPTDSDRNESDPTAEDASGVDSLTETSCPVRVLLAEDSIENQRLIRRFLERDGASVTTVENGRLAVEALAATARPDADGEPPFDNVLMDVEMPEMDGPTAVRALRRSGCELPIIALTAHGDPDILRGFVEAGYTGYLVKPVTSAELWREIRGRLARRAADPVAT
ncbi:hypothetical protein JCM17478_30540 [Thermopirellula anaerolimosa]